MKIFSLRGEQTIRIEFVTDVEPVLTYDDHYDMVKTLIDMVVDSIDEYHRRDFSLSGADYNDYETFEEPGCFEITLDCTGKMTEEDWERNNLIEIDTFKFKDLYEEKFGNKFAGENIEGIVITIEEKNDEIEGVDICNGDYF